MLWKGFWGSTNTWTTIRTHSLRRCRGDQVFVSPPYDYLAVKTLAHSIHSRSRPPIRCASAVRSWQRTTRMCSIDPKGPPELFEEILPRWWIRVHSWRIVVLAEQQELTLPHWTRIADILGFSLRTSAEVTLEYDLNGAGSLLSLNLTKRGKYAAITQIRKLLNPPLQVTAE